MPVSSGLIRDLTLVANELVLNMRKRISQNNLPDAIDKSIEIGQATSSGGTTFIVVSVGGKEAPMALAFEYGSGEHATRGNTGKYPIAPKNADLLAFNWQPDFVPWGSPKFFGAALSDPQNSTEGKYFFHFVEHPGVEARPYVKPSIEETLPKIKRLISGDIKAEMLIGTQRVTVIRA